MQANIILTGFGTVGREFTRLLLEKSAFINHRYHLQLQLVGVVGRNGCLFDPDGLELEALLACGSGSKALEQYAQLVGHPLTAPVFQGDVLVEATPTDVDSGEPGFSYLTQAIQRGMDVVAISKGALVTNFQALMAVANEHDVTIKYSGATAAALPTLDIGEYSLAGCELERIEGILNGTTNFILTQMHTSGLSFEEALQLAQQQGIAETDPSLDVKGLDSACKILLLCNGLFHTAYSLQDVNLTGIEGVTTAAIAKATRAGNKIKLVATAYRQANQVRLEVTPP